MATNSRPHVRSIDAGHPTARDVTSAAVVYELVALHELPALDPTKTIKSLVFSATQMRVFNRVYYRCRHVVAAMFILGNMVMFLVAVVPANVGQPLGAVSLFLQLPGILVTTLALRYEMVRLLVQTYDFWFFTLENAIFCACFGIILGDLRAAVLFLGGVSIQLGILVDAQMGKLRAFLLFALLNIVLHTTLFGITFFRLIDGSNHVVFLRYSHQQNEISTREMLANSMVNITILFARLWFRKRACTPQERRSWGTGRQQADDADGALRHNPVAVNTKCVGYWCRLQLVPKEALTSILSPPARILPLETTSGEHESGGRTNTMVRLQYCKVQVEYAARDTILFAVCGHRGSWFDANHCGVNAKRHTRRRILALVVLYANGIGGAVLTVLVWGLDFLEVLPHNNNQLLLRSFSLATTLVFCGTFFVFCQTRLLRQLCKSFDFVFLSAKVSVVVYCMYHLYSGKDRNMMVTLCNWWVWIHWLLTLDALTPMMRDWLAFRLIYAAPALFCMIVSQLLFVLELTWWNRLEIPDVLLVSGTIFGRRFQIHAMPIFFGNLITMVLSCCRVLWRIVRTSHTNDMVVLVGQVGYHGFNREHGKQRRQQRRGKSLKTWIVRKASAIRVMPK